ncbi:KinB-signaling pathway activation protein [Edaphobacillus lindanitolerans]|uniref:KinB signaling pathway activation protein n=1 Tax=Edaphobacillus lindanitolerans TaxID=550447 RepID=A0A1U7PPC4_9BACI|nr:KinB-signaling pathway activation protein [Edaphobacillus lindanitolerans]SIT88029.1 KinB signaling pathway activation protein [Edaphobacillus lindanitolerans]
MTIRNWLKFFLNALLIGGGITGLVGLLVRWNDTFYPFIQNGEISEFIAAFLWMVFLGFTMSVVAQMGFFAYLTVHQFGVNMFRSLTLWNWVQMLLIAVVLFDLVFFRFDLTKADTGRTVLYMVLLAFLLGVPALTAWLKVKMTGKKHILISALFFMIVITTLEWLPALMVRSGNIDQWVTILLFPLLAVNMYQLLMLPKYNAKSEEDLKKRQARREARKESGTPAKSKSKKRTAH